VAVAVAGILAAALTAGLGVEPSGVTADGAATRAFAALAAASMVAVAVLPFLLRRGTPRGVWWSLAAAALAAGIVSFVIGARIQRDCTARYDGRPIVVGTEFTETGRAYAQANPHLSRDELLFDARGAPGDLWTRRSIDRCRLLIRGTYFLWVPFLVICLAATSQAVPVRMFALPARDIPVFEGGVHSGQPHRTAAAPRYDVFLSYRHGGPDMEAARQLLEALEGEGYRVAIDERDFAANASFLEEMERCIRESRFTVAIISTRYLESGNCQEEAIVCKVLDMGERRRRLIPFVIEPVSMPAWLYGLVGIYVAADPLVDPVDRLKATLGPPLTAGTTS
jgi:hypothetical protein